MCRVVNSDNQLTLVLLYDIMCPSQIVLEGTIMMEIWKPVKGYEGLYEVSNSGRVRRITYRILTPFESDGYLDVSLCDGGERTTKRVHRLVADAFLERQEGKDEVNHINFDKKQNNVENLEWCNGSDNVQHNYNHGRTKRQRKVR